MSRLIVRLSGWLFGGGLCCLPGLGLALDLVLPTANTALLEPNRDAAFFQPTVEGSVASGMFGCVRRAGRRFHEGVDIRCVERDREGEPTDPVRAIAAGRVVFLNASPGLSNYGRYVVLEHRWDGVLVYSLYAHLRDFTDGLKPGLAVEKNSPLGRVGRSTNTREGISRERGHLHLEVGFMLNTRFDPWYRRRSPKAPPFGNYNGQNFVGLDPAALFRAFAGNPRLNFARYLSEQPKAFTVLVGSAGFPWLDMQPQQLQAMQTVEGSPPPTRGAYEIAVTSWGLPVVVWPRASEELTAAERRALQRGQPVLRLVAEPELARGNCRQLVRRRSIGRGWELSDRGREWVELLTYNP